MDEPVDDAETEDKRRRQQFTRWDLRAHWRTDVLTILAVPAAGYELFSQTWGVAIVFAILAIVCAAVPRSDVSAKLPFGGGIEARKRGSELKAPELATPEIRPAPAADDEQTDDEQTDDEPR